MYSEFLMFATGDVQVWETTRFSLQIWNGVILKQLIRKKKDWIIVQICRWIVGVSFLPVLTKKDACWIISLKSISRGQKTNSSIPVNANDLESLFPLFFTCKFLFFSST